MWEFFAAAPCADASAVRLAPWQRLLGRRAELAAVDEALERLQRRTGAVIAFSGEGGIGKTRLLDELWRAPASADCLVLSGRASELERELPFGVWEDALADHAAFLGVERLERLVGDQLPELAAVLPAVGASRRACRTSASAPTARSARCSRGSRREQPVVVVLDDLHWADDASLELVAAAACGGRRAAASLLALAFRPAPVRPLLATALATAERDGSVIEHAARRAVLRRRRDAARRRRPRAGARRDLRGRRRQPVLPPAARAPARGGPQRRRRAVRRRASRRRSRARSSRRSPRSARPAARLAQGAAVAGDPVDLDLAIAAAGLAEADALPALDELLAGALLSATDVPRRYRFRHPLVRLAIYESAADGWRIARPRPRRGGPGHARRLARRAGRITWSAARGPATRRPSSVLVEAGRHAAARAPATAADRFAAALRLLPETPETLPSRLELLVGLAQALAATGRLGAGAGGARRRPAAGRPRARAGPRAARRGLRDVREPARPPRRRPRAAARRARALSDGSFAAADLEVELAADALYDSDFAGVREWAARARATAETLAVPGFAAVATALECFGALGLGEIADAQALRADAAARLDALDDGALAGRLDTAYYLGFARVLLRALRRRASATSAAASRSRELRPGPVRDPDDDRPRARARGPRAPDEAAEHADAAVDGARLWGNNQMLCFALTADAWVSALRGELDRARAAGAEAMALLDGLDESVLSRATRVHVAAAMLEAGEPEGCLRGDERGRRPEFTGVEPGRRAWLYAILARAELALGHRAAAAEWVERGEAAAAGLGLPYAEASVLCARAQLDGSAPPALAAAERAESVGAVIQAGRARLLAGRAAGDDEAIALLERAEAELGNAGATRLRDEAARELRRRGVKATARRRRATGTDGLAVALRPRARGRRPGRAGAHEQGDRRRAVPVGEDDRDPHDAAVRQARRAGRGRRSPKPSGARASVRPHHVDSCAPRRRDRSSRRTSGSRGRRCSASAGSTCSRCSAARRSCRC